MATILCFEDNDDNLYLLHRRLVRAGFDVKVSTNGTEGVEWAKTLKPDLIVMDLDLPGLNGWEATRRLKSDPETSRIPVVILSSHGSARHREEAYSAGCDAYRTKPADYPGLIVEINGLLNKKAAG
jgi:two-component system, cell cycle response regulator DivK